MAYKELVDYIMDQLSGLNVRYIPMMGGYLFYIDDRVFGGIYDSGSLMVKITPASRAFMPDASADALQPVYLRLSQAERERQARLNEQ